MTEIAQLATSHGVPDHVVQDADQMAGERIVAHAAWHKFVSNAGLLPIEDPTIIVSNTVMTSRTAENTHTITGFGRVQRA